MKIVKKYVAIQIDKSKIDDKLVPNFKHGDYKYYDDYIQTLFDTEDEAIKWAYDENEWGNWMIVPVIKFDNF